MFDFESVTSIDVSQRSTRSASSRFSDLFGSCEYDDGDDKHSLLLGGGDDAGGYDEPLDLFAGLRGGSNDLQSDGADGAGMFNLPAGIAAPNPRKKCGKNLKSILRWGKRGTGNKIEEVMEAEQRNEVSSAGDQKRATTAAGNSVSSFVVQFDPTSPEREDERPKCPTSSTTKKSSSSSGKSRKHVGDRGDLRAKSSSGGNQKRPSRSSSGSSAPTSVSVTAGRPRRTKPSRTRSSGEVAPLSNPRRGVKKNHTMPSSSRPSAKRSHGAGATSGGGGRKGEACEKPTKTPSASSRSSRGNREDGRARRGVSRTLSRIDDESRSTAAGTGATRHSGGRRPPTRTASHH